MIIPYKDDNPTRRPPVVTIAIIVANVAMFVYFRVFVSDSEKDYHAVLMNLGLVPGMFLSKHLVMQVQAVPTFFTLFTSMFMHAGIMHLGGNMLYLWIFGNNIEDALGHVKFLLFYLFCGVCGAFAYMITQPGSHVPMVGASGAIAGVLGAYFMLFPRAQVRVLLFLFIFITTVTVPAGVVLGVWIAMQVWQGVNDMSAGGGVAWFAHIGGFFAGFLLIRTTMRRKSSKYQRYLN